MSVKDEQVRTTIAEQASEWFVANDDAPLDTHDSAALVAWLKASPVHVEEFLGVAGVARDLHAARSDPDFSLDALIERARTEGGGVTVLSPRFRVLAGATRARRWQLTAIALMLVGIVGFGLWMSRIGRIVPLPPAVEALRFEAGHGKQHTYRLADNSLLHLNTDSAVTVQYTPTQRLVVLASGEAAFEVAHEAKRAFRVLAGPAEVVDVGTRFDVRLRPGGTVVTVVEGRVAVGSARMAGRPLSVPAQDAGGRATIVEANQQVSVAEGQSPSPPVPVDAERATAWLHRQIVFEREPLERVAAEFNRYARKPVEIIAPELRTLEVSGSFSTDDMEEFLAFLRSLEGVRVDVTENEVRVSRK